MLNVVRVGGEDVSQGMRFERNDLAVTSLKDQSVAEEAYAGRHGPIG